MVFYLAKSAWVIHQVIGEVISNTRQFLQIYTIKEKSNADLFNKKNVTMKRCLNICFHEHGNNLNFPNNKL